MSVTIDGNTAQSLDIHLKKDYQEPGTPDVRRKEMVVPGRAGTIDFGSEYGEREIELPFNTLNTSSQSEVQDVIRNLADVLTDDDGEPKEVTLSFDKESGKHYKVKLAEGTGITRYPGNLAEFSLNLIATKPFAFSDTSTTSVNITSSGQTFNVTNSGSAPTPVKITITNSGSATINGFSIKRST